MPGRARGACRGLAAAVVAVGVSVLAFAPGASAAHHGLHIERATGAGGPYASSKPRTYPLRVRHPAAYRRAKKEAKRAYRRYKARHPRAEATPSARFRTAVSGSLNQPGLDATIDGRNLAPPDTTGAIGPNAYVEFINSEIAVYDRSTLASPPVAQLGESSFVGDPTASTCDTQIQWDQQGQRWLYAAANCGASRGNQAFYIGWSKTTDPTDLSASNWCRYTISTGHSSEDFPKLGHDDSQIIVGSNAFSDQGSQSYTGSHIFLFDKPAAGVTTCTSASTLGATSVETSADFTPVPANIADASAHGYVAATPDGTHLRLYEVGRNGSNANAVLSSTSVTVPAYSVPAPVPQPGTSDLIDSSDARLTQAVATTDPVTAKEGIWTQHTIAGAGGGPSVVRWYELAPGASSPRQTGTVSGPAGSFAFNGAISPTADGQNAAVFYNSGDGSHLVDLRAQDRHSGTALGLTGEDIQVASSTFADRDFSCSPCRWGDYAGASPDTANASLVWGTGELTTLAPNSGDAQWGTQNLAVDATTAVPQHSLTVTKSGSGSGTVASSPSALSCGSTCSASFSQGTTVTLTATPASGSSFTGWGGDCSGTGTCTLNMSTDHNVTASFTANPSGPSHTLTVIKSGSGSGTVTSSPAGISCGTACAASFNAGASVTLTATPTSASTFAGWSGGGCSGSGVCTVTMSADRNVTASFSSQPLPPPGRAPNTKITRTRISSPRHKATFTFRAIGDATRFQCELKRPHRRAHFAACTSPKRYKHLRIGRYTFKVRAVGPGGADASAARKRFRIRR